MSGGARSTAVPTMQLGRLRDPLRAADLNNLLTQIESADRANLKRGQESYFPSVLLRGTDGATYRLTVNVVGGVPTLELAVVPR